MFANTNRGKQMLIHEGCKYILDRKTKETFKKNIFLLTFYRFGEMVGRCIGRSVKWSVGVLVGRCIGRSVKWSVGVSVGR